MKPLMIASVLLGLASTARAQAPTTGDVRLDLFRGACIESAADAGRIRSLGWTTTAPAADPRLAELLTAIGQVEAEADEEAAPVSPYRRSVDGKTYYLLLIDVQSAYAQLEGCVLYDFDASGPLDPALITRWLNARPDKVDDQPGSILGHYWDIAGQDGIFGVNSAFLTRGGRGAQQARFWGLALATTVRVGEPIQIVR